MPRKIYLVDGSGYIFRAFYAVAPLTNRDGFPTNALFGYVRMLLKLLQASDSEHVAVAFDAGRDTFRTEMYKAYKANRQECPEDLRKQMPYFREVTAALGLPVLELKGYEADDIIGTLTKRLSQEGVEVVIVSGDKDLMQLVDEQVSIWDTMHDRRFKSAEVQEKFGVPPSQVVEVLGLMGDSSDNVPGLDGVGPKTASALVEKYGSIENIITSAEAIKNDSSIRNRKKIAEQIEKETELLRTCRKLVEIHCDVPLEFKSNGGHVSVLSLPAGKVFDSLGRSAPDKAKLQELVDRFEFSSLMRDLNLSAKSAQVDSAFKYSGVFADDFADFCARLAQQPAFALDIEATALAIHEAKLVGISFCWADDGAYYVPISHQLTPAGKSQVSLDELKRKLGPILADPKISKSGQNIKYDMSVLAEHGIEVAGVDFDSMLASYLLNPDKGAHNLTVLANEYLKLPVQEYEDLVGDMPNFSFVPIDAATRYGCQDAHYVWLLRKVLWPRLQGESLLSVFQDIEMPLVPVLSRMERQGVLVDGPALEAMSHEFTAALERMQTELFTLAGTEFNLNSPKQLADVLFNKLGLPTKGIKKTKTGVSTDSGALEKLSPLHPLPALILRYRTIYKLKSTYVDALNSQISRVTGRLHTRFNQAVTGTGRLSSSDPNLQNIPVQTEEGRRIRSAFVALPGSSFISADYSQIELRVLAHLSGDENLISAFSEGIDIHAKTAREIMGLAVNEEISPEIRRIGKTINFGVIYGMGPYRLSRELGIPLTVAQDYIEGYFRRFPRVREFFAQIEQDAEKKGFVTTLYGRKRFTATIDAADRDQGFVARAAMNAPIQGTAADLMKLAMIRIDKRIARDRARLRMILQIHDELVFECQDSYLDVGTKLVKDEMEQVAEFRVPLCVEVGVGKNWEAAHA